MIDTEFGNILEYITEIYNKGDYNECIRTYNGMIRGVCEFHMQYHDLTEDQREILESIIRNADLSNWKEFISHLS